MLPPEEVDALTFGRNVQPARERRLFDMITVPSLSKQALTRNHVWGQKIEEGKERYCSWANLISEVARLKLSTSLAIPTGGLEVSAF
jgi:hypothetical protein